MSSKKTKNPIKEAKLAVDTLGILVTVCFLGVLSGFYYWFSVHLDRRVSEDVSVWGAFGDFVGGTLNPLVSLFTLMIVCRAYLSQREELHDTKTALMDTSKATQIQNDLVKIQNQIVVVQGQIDVLTTKTSHYSAEMKDMSDYIARLHNSLDRHVVEGCLPNTYSMEGKLLNSVEDVKEQIFKARDYIIYNSDSFDRKSNDLDSLYKELEGFKAKLLDFS